MCSVFEFLDMDNFQGDLTDIIRGSGGGHVSPSPVASPTTSWQAQLPPPPSDLLSDFPSTGQNNSFGDPFVNMSDPLLQELNVVATSGYFAGGDSVCGGSSGSSTCSTNNNFMVPKVFEDDMKSQCNIFPRIRISQSNIIHEASPCNSPIMAAATAAGAVSSSPRGIIGRSPVAAAAAMAGNHDVINVNTNGPNNCHLVDNNSSSQIQISSPRNLGLKRRKSQAKKVVCIPAPAAANSRSSGEVVPSDLWAWRKYGQKPIKGSPYPRGYYRCSSSKGCSARKQVERSRTDPNMLVITYTSEHNHPWPTQRNALAGSTRSSHPCKSTTTTNTSSTSSRSPQSHLTSKDEPSKSDEPPFAGGGGVGGVAASAVKEEIEDQVHDEQQDMEFDNHNDIDDQSSSYRPGLLPEFHHQPEDFFADLDELEGDPLSVLLSQGYGSGAGDGEFKGKPPSDPFGNFFDWSADHNGNNNDNTASFDDGDSSKSSL